MIKNKRITEGNSMLNDKEVFCLEIGGMIFHLSMEQAQ